jgi:Carbamoyl-phosphate synthase small chain, CPSase domain
MRLVVAFLPIQVLRFRFGAGHRVPFLIMDGTKKTSMSSPLSSVPLRDVDAVLELQDGVVYAGVSFGAAGKSVAGECVFQTGD